MYDYYNNIILINNKSQYLIKPIYYGIIPIIYINNSTCINNELNKCVIVLNYAPLNFTNSIINNHLLVIHGIDPIIII